MFCLLFQSPSLTLETVERLVTKTFKEWANLQPEDIEFAINLLFSIGETITVLKRSYHVKINIILEFFAANESGQSWCD